MYQTFLRSSSFFALLSEIDEEIADQAREAGCSCGGVLHSARYPRKPRGGPEEPGPKVVLRASFCCSVEGCRRRLTPPSVRFLGRKVYFGVWVLLLLISRTGPTPERLRRLEEVFGVGPRTLGRWRRWWREAVVASRFWVAMRGRFVTPVAAEALPGSLLVAFSGLSEPGERVVSVLRWLSPVAGGRGLLAGGF